MKVGDLVRLKYKRGVDGSCGVIIKRINNPEWGAGWEYEILWSDPILGWGTSSYKENALEVISEIN